jgi:hypothetical protein
VGVSGYLSVYDDWDLLAETLATVAPLLDELVVVDGAYRWMAPLLERQGRDPLCSDPRVHAALEGLACPVRVVTGLWADETEKRAAGYAACTGRWVLRVDADEDWGWAHADPVAALGRHAVGEVEYPIQVTPGWIKGNLEGSGFARTERQGVLFDSRRIDARAHLGYLWLVLGQERAGIAPIDPGLIDPEPLGFCAHLTHWRTPATAVNRARFYVMNYMRNAGAISWAPGVPCRAEDGFAALFDAVPPDAFEHLLLTHEIVAGAPDMQGAALRAAPLDAARQAALTGRHARALDGLVGLNRRIRGNAWSFADGGDAVIDLSTPEACTAFGVRDGTVTLRFDGTVAAARGIVASLLPGPDPVRKDAAAVEMAGDTVRLVLPQAVPGAVRRTLRLCVWDAARRRLATLIPD